MTHHTWRILGILVKNHDDHTASWQVREWRFVFLPHAGRGRLLGEKPGVPVMTMEGLYTYESAVAASLGMVLGDSKDPTGLSCCPGDKGALQ